MVRFILVDLFRVLLFPKDKTYLGDLNPLFAEKSRNSEVHFNDYLEFNSELLTFLSTLTPKYTLCLFTAASQIQQTPEVQSVLAPLFQLTYTTEKLGMRKTDPESFQLVCSYLRAIPPEIVYIGDNSACVEAAGKAGISGILFTTNSQTISDLKSRLNL